jgi:hypothetical protein
MEVCYACKALMWWTAVASGSFLKAYVEQSYQWMHN